MRGRTIFLTGLVFAVLGAAAGWAADTDAVRIGAIFAVTGPAANLGLPESRTLQMLVDDANSAGGIGGRKIELIIKDSQGSAEKAISFAKQLVEENEVLAIIGPSTSGESMKLKGYCEENETILLSCAAAETIVNPVAKWVFKVPQMDSFAAQMIFATMKRHGNLPHRCGGQQHRLRPGRQGAAGEARPGGRHHHSPSRGVRRGRDGPHGRADQGEGPERAGRGELVQWSRPSPSCPRT